MEFGLSFKNNDPKKNIIVKLAKIMNCDVAKVKPIMLALFIEYFQGYFSLY